VGWALLEPAGQPREPIALSRRTRILPKLRPHLRPQPRFALLVGLACRKGRAPLLRFERFGLPGSRDTLRRDRLGAFPGSKLLPGRACARSATSSRKRPSASRPRRKTSAATEGRSDPMAGAVAERGSAPRRMARVRIRLVGLPGTSKMTLGRVDEN
jgi:hypothetical protein